jgi:hypothetical protein
MIRNNKKAIKIYGIIKIILCGRIVFGKHVGAGLAPVIYFSKLFIVKNIIIKGCFIVLLASKNGRREGCPYMEIISIQNYLRYLLRCL